MKSEVERLARIRGLIKAFNRHSAVDCTQHLAHTVTWNRGDGASLQGRETLTARLQDILIAFPDASLTRVQLLPVQPDAVLVEWVLEATHLGEWELPGSPQPIPATGRSVSVVGADLFGFNASNDIEWDEARIDVAALLAQISDPSSASADPARLRDFAERYTAAWKSRNAASVAAFYAQNGSLSVNAGASANGRPAITEIVQGYMTGFPDLDLQMDGILIQGNRAVYRWIFLGTNTGPGGTGQRVRFSGFEVWLIGADGLIAESRGRYDSAAYQRQLERGFQGPQ